MRKTVIPVLLAISLSAYAQETKKADTAKTTKIEEVVVTSLGIKRQVRSLTYSSQQIGGDELTEVKTPNLLNSINGKVSNVQINKTNGGVGGSVRITMRGDKSTRNSQPLYVIDGVPIVNNTGITGTGGPNVDYFSGMPDTGDVLSTINPEDIESINFLKGASAAALYGSQGSNGAVLIVTKKGAAGRSSISFSSSITFDDVYNLPKLQNSYLQSTPYNAATGATGTYDSWGGKGASKDYVKKFFDTGITRINSLSFQAGNEKTTNFFSLGSTNNTGVIPTSTFDQYNINYRNSSKFLGDKLTLDANVMASLQNSKNRLTPGSYFSPISNLYWLPRGIDFDQFSGDNYTYFNNTRFLPAQNWWAIRPDGGFEDSETQNPYWILNKNPVTTKNKNFYGSASLSYALNSWLTAKLRGNYNYYNSDTQRNIYAFSNNTVSGINGKLSKNTIEKTTTYSDFILAGSPKINDNLSFDFTVGASISDLKYTITNIENNRLFTANLFTLNNLAWNGEGNGYKIDTPHRQDQSVFASANFGYKRLLYLDLTYRVDWSSTLSKAPKNSFDYYSVGLNSILSDVFKLPEAINFWKVRASYATVGNALDPTSTYPQPIFNGGVITGSYSSAPVDIANFPQFAYLFPKPEMNKTFEAGTEFRLFNNRLSFDFTYYNSNVSNQYLKNVSTGGSIYGTNLAGIDISAGKIQNTGFESSLSYKVFDSKKFGWTVAVNASANKNRIKEVFPIGFYTGSGDVKPFFLTGGGYNGIKVGGSFGDIYGTAFLRDTQGRIVVTADGVPQLAADRQTFLGNPNPKFMLGFNNTFNIGKVNINFLIDGKFGGKVLGITQALNDKKGVSQVSADARDNGGVSIANAAYANGTAYTGKTDARAYYDVVGGSGGINEAYMYNATNVRLRQASISYQFSINGKYFKDATLSLIGTNLFFLYNKAPFDPEQVSGVNPGGVGVDILGMPITRSIGFSVKANF